MQELKRLARQERLIIVCTIDQPSSKVYNGFDQIMLLTKGQQAFSGDARDAVTYFERMRFPCPPATNPAEHLLDLVDPDFSDEDIVNRILQAWSKHSEILTYPHENLGEDLGLQDGVAQGPATNFLIDISVMFRRHSLIIFRNPFLYIGRCVLFLFANAFLAFVYWNVRPYTQEQALSKVWLSVWLCGIPCGCEFMLFAAVTRDSWLLNFSLNRYCVSLLQWARLRSIF